MKAVLLLLVLALVLIDARSVKNLQIRASKRIIKKALVKDLPPWCSDRAQVKDKVKAPDAATRCDFFTTCIKAAVATSEEDLRCTRLAGLTSAANGLGEASIGVRDLYLVTVADALAAIIGTTPTQEAVTKAVDDTFAANFGTAGNNGEAPAVPEGAAAPPTGDAAAPTTPPTGLAELESATGEGDAAAPPTGDAAAPTTPPPEVENNAAPTFCACPHAEQLILVTSWMPPPPVPLDQVEAKIATISCGGEDFGGVLVKELGALKTEAAEAYGKIEAYLKTAISGWVEGGGGGGDAAPAPAPVGGDATAPPTGG